MHNSVICVSLVFNGNSQLHTTTYIYISTLPLKHVISMFKFYSLLFKLFGLKILFVGKLTFRLVEIIAGIFF